MTKFQKPSWVSFSQQEIADACAKWGACLWLKGLNIDGALLLWALAGKESSFGRDCTPRHEMGYCTGRYAQDAKLQELTRKIGCAAHASFGPWQLMAVNALPGFEVEDFARPEFCAMKTVQFLNREILGRQGAKTVVQIADAYNSGNFRDKNVPTLYIATVEMHYAQAKMPSATAEA